MSVNWNDHSPIYKQLEALIVSWILKKQFAEGEALPSVRKLSVEYQINHLTVAKSLQNLVDQDLIEKRRGLGMFVKIGAVERLISIEREKFFTSELPALQKRISELGISKATVLAAINEKENNGD